MSNWNFNGTLEENGKRVITKGAGVVNMIGAREEASVSFANDDGKMVMTLNIPTGSGGTGGGGTSEAGVGKFWKDGDGNVLGEYFNNYNPVETYEKSRITYVTDDDFGNQATGLYSHAEGDGTLASGRGAHAEGSKYQYKSGCYHPTTASGKGSHAEGIATIASGEGSHAEGFESHAPGNYSHAEGHLTHADGNYSHAEGYETSAKSECQHVQGKYNVEDTSGKYADIVGGGTYWDRKNISTLDWSGNLTIAGDIYVGNTSEPLLKCLTQAEFDALTTKNPKTLYLIKEEE